MDNFLRSLAGAVALLVLAFGPALTAAWFLQRRKRIARKQRRSPLTADLLRGPGHALRERLEDLRMDLSFDLASLMAVPVFPLGYLQLHSMFTGAKPNSWVLVLCVVGAGGFTVLMIRRMMRTGEKLDHLRLGMDAELAVGQELDQLMRDGAVVFHDMPAERFNIDHVVIARQGVFAVETKGYSKPNRGGGPADAKAVYDGKALVLPDRSGTKAIGQTERQAKWLAKWLHSSTGQPVRVTPVLALPGWWVDRKGRGEVLVFSGGELRGSLLKACSAEPLAPDQMQRVVHQIEQRCRTVEPSYRPQED